MKIFVIQSNFNKDITDSLFKGAKNILETKNKKFSHHLVSGSWEILSLASKILRDQRDEEKTSGSSLDTEDIGILAIGAIIRGETDHYDFLCNATFNGLASLQVKYGVPISIGILTTENINQAKERSGGKKGNKGSEAALALLNLL